MEITQQPLTIGEMTPQHFQAFIIQIIKQVTDPRFEAIDKRFEAIDRRFEAIDERFEKIDRRFDAIDERFDILETAVGQLIDDVEEIKTTLRSNQNRFGLIEGTILRHDQMLSRQVA